MNAITTTLSAPAPFSLEATVLSHGWHECSPMSWSFGGRCFQTIDRIGDDVFRVSIVEKSRTKSKVTLGVTLDGPVVQTEFVPVVKERLARVLGLHRDLAEFHALCAADAALSPIPKIGAGRAIRSASMTENVVKAICGTNVLWDQAIKMITRIGQLGPCLKNYRNLHAWPTPREILRAGEKYLVEVARVGYRAESILEVCANAASGKFNPDELDDIAADESVSTDELFDRVTSLRGVGPATANYLISFLGRHDRLSIDSATVAHVARVHTKGRTPSHKQIEKIYAKYGKWKQLAWWYEHWLTWGTAQRMLKEAGIKSTIMVDPPAPKKAAKKTKPAAKRGAKKSTKRKRSTAA